MDNQMPASGDVAGSRKLGAIIAVLAALAIAALGVFYLLQPKSVEEAPVAEEEVLPAEEATVAGAEAIVVSIKDFKFVPETVTIKTGESVTWENNEAGVPHSIVLDNGDYKSATVFPGESETRRFSVAGTFPYHCGIHPGMKGVVIVK